MNVDNVKVLIFDMDDTLINHGHVTKPTWIKTVTLSFGYRCI